MTALECAPWEATPDVVVRLLDHPRFQKAPAKCAATDPHPTQGVVGTAHRKHSKIKRVSPLALIGTGGLYLAIIADLYLRFFS